MNDTTTQTTDERCAIMADEAFRCAALCQFRAEIEPWMADEAAEFADKLVRTVNEGGGITCITSGYLPKREVYELMHAYLAGLRAAKEAA